MGPEYSVPYDPPTQTRLARFGAMDMPKPNPATGTLAGLTPEQVRALPLSTLKTHSPEALTELIYQQALALIETQTQLDFARSREWAATRRLPLAMDLDRRSRRAARAEQELLSNRVLMDYKERLIQALRDPDPDRRGNFLTPTRLASAQVSLMWRDLRQQFFRVLELPVPAAGPLEELNKEQQLALQQTRLVEIYSKYPSIERMNTLNPGAEVLLSSRSAGYAYMSLFIPSRMEPTWRSAFEMNLDNPKSFTAKALILLSQQALTLAKTYTHSTPLKIHEYLITLLAPLKPSYL
ncbi:hypothetical protein [Anthocerotibacter panamensis]|uniref:hypothetical protein n=1 Tax=Anthocerotibacter panamensis TaxID=2857077 RepID=UPI001C403801|nr:hypothetical protein [Anthocerotibacter panamensis]